MRSTHEVKRLFIDHAFIGNVLRYSTLLEAELGVILGQYFLRTDHAAEGMELLLAELTFHRKIEILKTLPVRKTRSHEKATHGLICFKRIRNMVAHQWTLSTKSIDKLLGGTEYRAMLGDYPQGMRALFLDTRAGLVRLLRTREFAVQSSVTKFDFRWHEIMKIFE